MTVAAALAAATLRRSAGTSGDPCVTARALRTVLHTGMLWDLGIYAHGGMGYTLDKL